MTTAYFAGGEIPVYRELLYERGVKHVSLNWVNHQRRVKADDWRIADYFPDGSGVFIDSGARAYTRPGVNVTHDEIIDLATTYYRFIANNLPRIAGYLEFDHPRVDRGEVDPNYDSGKGLYVWHAGSDDTRLLDELGPHIAVVEEPTPDSERFPVYRRHARDKRLHLIGADRTVLDAQIKWDSCHFSAWYSAQQRGEMFVWAGNQLRRYMPDRRDIAMKRHRPLIESLGLDLSLVARGDGPENLKLAIWSWSQYFSNLNHEPTTHPVTGTPDVPTPPNADLDPQAVAETDPEWRHDQVTQSADQERPRKLWPGLETTEHTIYAVDPQDGVKRPRTELRLAAGDAGIRACTGCYLAESCPEYSPGSKCAFNFTAEINTKEQRQAARSYLLGVQMGRVSFGVAGEQRDGGHPDKAVSAEMDRLGRFLKDADDVESAGFTLSIKANQQAATTTGLLTRLFGREAEPLPIENSGIVEAEVLSDTADTRSEHVTERSD